MIKTSIGIMAYNEEANILRLLNSLTSQKTKRVTIAEIIVIASGCTDRTVTYVEEMSRKDKRVKLFVQKKREGKARAVNLFIKYAKSPVLVMISADTLPDSQAIEYLVSPFSDREIGMTSARIIPVNKKDTFMGFYINTFWQLHHEVAKRSFKAGELVAWRNVIKNIHPETSTDETNLAALIIKRGLKTVYMSQALVYNRGPENWADYLKVRRRHLSAYYHLKETVGLSYLPPTMNNVRVFKLYLKLVGPNNLKELIWLAGVMFAECIARVVAWYDWRIKREHHPIWSVAKSTKKLPPIK